MATTQKAAGRTPSCDEVDPLGPVLDMPIALCPVSEGPLPIPAPRSSNSCTRTLGCDPEGSARACHHGATAGKPWNCRRRGWGVDLWRLSRSEHSAAVGGSLTLELGPTVPAPPRNTAGPTYVRPDVVPTRVRCSPLTPRPILPPREACRGTPSGAPPSGLLDGVDGRPLGGADPGLGRTFGVLAGFGVGVFVDD